MGKIRLRKKYRYIVFIIGIAILAIFIYVGVSFSFKQDKPLITTITDFKGKSLSEAQLYIEEHNLLSNIKYEYSKSVLKDSIISSNYENNILNIVVSNGRIPNSVYEESKVDELGKVPVMMYHGIINQDKTDYIGGNVDKDGYNRTSKAFREDLEFYYKSGYRMIRLIDYINGNINVELGYSPIVLTFDDGNRNNFNVLGRDSNGDLIIDDNSAVGILESFKEKYPNFNVTATFFVMKDLFNQKEYNEEILKWLIDHGYDIGNHTTNHANFSSINSNKTMEVVGKMYQILDEYIKDKYVHIVALPYGSPYNRNHSNYPYILKGEYNGYSYETLGALRVGWDSEVSPFNKVFDKTFIKRCRAYDNNGLEFDIKMVFNNLEKNKYVSDGDSETIVIKESSKNNLSSNYGDKEIIIY